MVGWMDDEALHRTLTTGRATFWSRSREEYWVKGETSGHRQWVKEVRLDCDGDTLLVTVDQEGPACHTGDRTCFDARRCRREIEATRGGRVRDRTFGPIVAGRLAGAALAPAGAAQRLGHGATGDNAGGRGPAAADGTDAAPARPRARAGRARRLGRAAGAARPGAPARRRARRPSPPPGRARDRRCLPAGAGRRRRVGAGGGRDLATAFTSALDRLVLGRRRSAAVLSTAALVGRRRQGARPGRRWAAGTTHPLRPRGQAEPAASEERPTLEGARRRSRPDRLTPSRRIALGCALPPRPRSTRAWHTTATPLLPGRE